VYIHDVIGTLRETQLRLQLDLHAMGTQLHMIEFLLKDLKRTVDEARGYVSRETSAPEQLEIGDNL